MNMTICLSDVAENQLVKYYNKGEIKVSPLFILNKI
jgi:hypothetical protein